MPNRHGRVWNSVLQGQARRMLAGAQKAQLAMVFGGRGFFLGKTEGVGCRVLPSSGGWWFRNLSHEPLGPMLWGPVLVLSLQSASSTRLGVVNACPGRRTQDLAQSCAVVSRLPFLGFCVPSLP